MATTILTFFQAMVTYPQWQAEAQQEIDTVLSDHEMPSWMDYGRLPTVAMIVKEFLRWRPPAPGLFPYTLTNGMFLHLTT
jgi:cytochrome P450